MVDTKGILLKSRSENLYGQVIVVQSKKGNRKIKRVNECMKKLTHNVLLFFFNLIFAEGISGHVTERMNTTKNAVLEQT